MNTIQPAPATTDIQTLRVETLRLLATMVDTEHRPAPNEIVMHSHSGRGDDEPPIPALRLQFDDPDHVTAWAGLERAEGYLFKRERHVSRNGKTEMFQATLIGYLTPVWHGWEQVYLTCTRDVPTAVITGGTL